jgi:hypothetical protein
MRRSQFTSGSSFHDPAETGRDTHGDLTMPISLIDLTTLVLSLVAGTWRGTSQCGTALPACRDEVVVFRVVPSPEVAGGYSVTADKIVDGRAITMGTLEFRYDEGTSTLTSNQPQGRWVLHVDGTKMSGTLTTPQGAVARVLALNRDPQS